MTLREHIGYNIYSFKEWFKTVKDRHYTEKNDVIRNIRIFFEGIYDPVEPEAFYLVKAIVPANILDFKIKEYNFKFTKREIFVNIKADNPKLLTEKKWLLECYLNRVMKKDIYLVINGNMEHVFSTINYINGNSN